MKPNLDLEFIRKIEFMEFVDGKQRIQELINTDLVRQGFSIIDDGKSFSFHVAALKNPMFNRILVYQDVSEAYLTEKIGFYQNQNTKPRIEIPDELISDKLRQFLTSSGFSDSGQIDVYYSEKLDSFKDQKNDRIRIQKIGDKESDLFLDVFVKSNEIPESAWPNIKSLFAHWIDLPNRANFLLFEDSIPVASCCAVFCGEYGALSGVSTIPEKRGQGYQKYMIQKRIEYLKSQGVTSVVSMPNANTISSNNYEKMGFDRIYQKSVWAY
ncbi:MAG: GNAT family N-acetyltransferase [Pseudobacteriovorax sp.]|nr:GNAT family N-acetyltransferase [Pseudobacteriovorax sp.]